MRADGGKVYFFSTESKIVLVPSFYGALWFVMLSDYIKRGGRNRIVKLNRVETRDLLEW